MRDPTINVEVEQAIAAAELQLKGFIWFFKNPCTLDPHEVAARDKACRWLMAAVPALPPGLAPPPGAEEMILRRLKGREPPPKRKRGRHEEGKFRIRDRIIVQVIELTMNERFKPTRNREQKGRESACSIVCTALKRLGVKMKEGTIEDIWADRA
jgi:hypothetical protein